MTRTGLLVIGDVVTDVVALHGGPALAGLALGTDTAADIVLRPGGSGANTASWAAHLGADVRILTRVGFDTGEWHAAELRRVGVRPHLRMDPDRPTAVVIAMVDATGERSMLTNRGAGGHIGVDDWDATLLDGVRHLHLSGYTLFAEPGLQLSRLAMAEATLRGVTISVDPASTGPLRAFGPERFVQETLAAQLIIPNLDEALLLSGESSAERAAERLSLRYGAAAVKLGSRGALMAKDGKLTARVPGIATEVVDSTGAGDAFAAGLLTALLRGADDEAALDAGRRAGAEAVTAIGGRPRILASELGTDQLYPLNTN
ncbi:MULTISPECIES: carbohydrate kinase family protein [Streptosporangium]|uniref:carbohydrate kinase family protein n=1 Tax=Streptosporangium TaxID=2000 RepID=UPI0004CD3DBD|nr:sugar kinase [Streptosporangium roseum]